MAHILIVDDDALSRKVLTATLGKDRHSIASAADGDLGLASIRERVPDLVITDVIMPRMDGWRFVQALRAMPEAGMVPVIFLTVLHEDHHRLRGFGLGADDYIGKPVNTAELRFRVDRSIQRAMGMANAAKQGLQANAMFVGDVGQFGPASLLNLLSNERKSGELTLTGESLITRLRFRNGVVIGATTDGDQRLRGVDAVYQALGWWAGQFSFTAGECAPPASEEQVQASVTFLLMEAARRLDDRERSADGRDR